VRTCCRFFRTRMTKFSSDAPVEPGPLLLLESVLALAVARLVVVLVPFRRYSRAMGWLRSGDVCVTGQAELDRYTVVATFADEAKR
jgi:hypothetical protein